METDSETPQPPPVVLTIAEQIEQEYHRLSELDRTLGRFEREIRCADERIKVCNEKIAEQYNVQRVAKAAIRQHRKFLKERATANVRQRLKTQIMGKPDRAFGEEQLRIAKEAAIGQLEERMEERPKEGENTTS